MIDVMVEKELVERVVQGLVEADLSKDLNRIMEFYSDDIIYQFQGRPSLFGVDELKGLLEAGIPELEDLKAGSYRVEVSDSGDLAYSVGWIKVKNYGMEDYADRKYIIICRKIDGDWKIATQSVSSNT